VYHNAAVDVALVVELAEQGVCPKCGTRLCVRNILQQRANLELLLCCSKEEERVKA